MCVCVNYSTDKPDTRNGTVVCCYFVVVVFVLIVCFCFSYFSMTIGIIRFVGIVLLNTMRAIIVLQMYCYYKCSVALPHGAMDWSAVCHCGIF